MLVSQISGFILFYSSTSGLFINRIQDVLAEGVRSCMRSEDLEDEKFESSIQIDLYCVDIDSACYCCTGNSAICKI